MKSEKHIIFRIGDEEYGLSVMDVKAIENDVNINVVPNAPAYLKGIIQLRGDVIPVYSLRQKFGLEDKEPDDSTKLIITTSNDILMAYEVDLVHEIIEIEENQMIETPGIVKCDETKYIKNVANINGRLIILLDYNGILAVAEQENAKILIKELSKE